MTTETTIEARIDSPAALIPEAMPHILGLLKAVHKGGVDGSTLELVHLRASQINGCSVCVFGGTVSARKAGVSEEQLASVAAWREAPFFSAAERAALDLAEHATRLADRSDPVPDAVWNEAARHYDDKQLAAITLMVGVTNLFNRLNATTRQPAGQTW
ncbi:carboxymuconolactone decarboxylase family protein [Streptomyces sp. NPDC052225]|uniref:carboxymuconolactone decarboxylase family protein n=1 Tax=Streptomyces sp. NPDC052225 TaxID=3154949 RepID=UPI00342567DC